MGFTKNTESGGARPSPRAGRRQRTPLEMARDREKITRLRLVNRLHVNVIADIISKQYEGEENPEGKLAPQIGVEQIRKELTRSKTDFEREQLKTILEKRAALIREYRALEAYCMERYDATLCKKITKTTEEKEGSTPNGGNNSVTRKTVKQNTDGDKGYIDLAERCKWRVAELEAIIPPRKTALTNPEGTEAFKFETGEEWKRLTALSAELLGIRRETETI